MKRKRLRVCGVIAAAGVLMFLAACGSRTAGTPPAADIAAATSLTAAPDTAAVPAVGKITYGDDPAQFGWLSLPDTAPPDNGFPIAILVHGGFWSEPWDYNLMSPLADDLADRGFATWNIEFRRLGGRGGWPHTFDDVSAAIDHLMELASDRPLDLQRSALIGHSSGGHLALWALDRESADVQPAAAIGLGAVVDLEAFPQAQALLGGTSEKFAARYAAAAPSLDAARVALVHGDQDRIVPPATLTPALTGGVSITLVPDTDHFAVIDPLSDAWAVTVDLLKGFLPA